MEFKRPERNKRFKTSISFDDTEIKLKEVDVNLCSAWMKPT
jgi:hypothetical protein